MIAERFAIVPIQACQDKRLTLKQLRVLVALLSFLDKDMDTVWPKREAIAKRCGMLPANISTATTELERLGWLEKVGNGGRNKAARYRITTPETVSDPETVSESETVSDSVTKTVSDSDTRIELPSELPRGKRRRKAEMTLAEFLEACRSEGREAIPKDDSIFAYAETVGISSEMVDTQWDVFKEKYLETGKRQKDWPATFRNAVRGAWYSLWRINEGQSAVWTTAGQQARIARGVGFQRDAA